MFEPQTETTIEYETNEDIWKKNWIIRKSNFGPSWVFYKSMLAAYWCQGQDKNW